ncbi:EpsG family protein [Parabacteroides merdae]|uniref:EpsG family protein n=1 Tax=Parabacteroides merdae TaxID=46503 RepID=UPI00189BB0DD|nr:EpsG family protein [Parabacteroides merdae]MDB8921186.1 EpsG family protein [Parabacteroides merdae]
MYIVIFTSFIALLLTFLESKKVIQNGMKWGFVLVTFIGCIHYDYGNDYMSYLNIYKDVTQYDFDLKGILSGIYFREPGWALLCWLFKSIGGFFMMVAVLNIIQNYIVYRCIAREVDKAWWPVAFFVYLFSTSYYLMSFSMMRQEFVIIVFLGLWKYIKSRRWWIVLVVLYLCSFVHTSALVLLPFAFWGFMPMGKSKFIGAVYLVFLLLLWLGQEFTREIFVMSLNSEEVVKYADAYGNRTNTIKIGVGFVLNLIPIILSLLFLFKKKKQYTVEERQLVALAIVANLITPFTSIIPLAGRLGMYFGVYSIVSYPLIYGNVERKDLRYVLVSIMIFMLLYDYVLFFNNPVWVEKYSEFHTIFPLI